MPWRLLGVVISVVLVSEYIVLVGITLAFRALLGAAAGVWRRLLPSNKRRREATISGAEAA